MKGGRSQHKEAGTRMRIILAPNVFSIQFTCLSCFHLVTSSIPKFLLVNQRKVGSPSRIFLVLGSSSLHVNSLQVNLGKRKMVHALTREEVREQISGEIT